MTNYTIHQRAKLPTTVQPIVSIGAGGIVHDAHYPAYRKAGFEIIGLFDPNTECAEMMADKFDVPHIFTSIDHAASQTPSNAVFDVAVPASAILDVLYQLPNERAVLIQKPMGENLGEAREIRTLCEKKGLTAAINFQMRYAPFVIAARSLIDQGIIGDVHDMEIRVTVYTPWHLWPFLQKSTLFRNSLP